MDGDGSFRSAHDALLFAHRYADQQSPRTPMSRMLQGGPLGRGSGLVGLDGAGQAGLILAALRHLSAEQRALIVVRYGDMRHECPCCGQQAPSKAWAAALDELSHAPELADLPRPLRHAAVERVVCRRRISLSAWASRYDTAERTVRHRVQQVRKRFGKVEHEAIAWLSDHYEAHGLVCPAMAA